MVEKNYLTHDQTTGLINHRAFVAEVDATITEILPFMIFYLGLDRFQPVNEVLGRSTGDQVLDQVARRLISGIEAGVLLAHIDGGAFALLWPNLKGHIDAGAPKLPCRLPDSDK